MAYLTDDILSDAKLRANFPSTGSVAITDPELLQLANDELLGILTGRLMSAMSGYFAAEASIPTVAGTATYDIPQRAAGAKINYVAMVAAGSGQRRTLVSSSAGAMGGINRTPNAAPGFYFFQGNQIVLVPAPADASETLTVGYFVRPNRLQLVANCAQVTAKSSTTVTISLPTGNITSNSLVDFIRATPHFLTLGTDAAVTVAGTTYTFAAGVIPSTLAIGDYVCLANESCVVQLPVEVQPLLAARIALRILRQRGDMPQADAMKQDVGDLESNVLEFLTNRSESQIESMYPGQLLGNSGAMANYTGWTY